MTIYTCSNSKLTIKIKSKGAELCSIINNSTKKEYMWSGDEKFWSRHSPILFPIVGSLKNKQYNYNNNLFSMNQHGFARDLEFNLVEKTNNHITFSLNSNTETYKNYPFKFCLTIQYRLIGNSIRISWNVVNLDKKVMYFSIGAHPAFVCPPDTMHKFDDCSIKFDSKSNILYANSLTENGLLECTERSIPLNDKTLKLNYSLFDNDALIIENDQAHSVTLTDKYDDPYISIYFDAPLFGLWSPKKKNAPFICIEPWYGRCDSNNFSGTLENREYSNSLNPNKQFNASYTIEIH